MKKIVLKGKLANLLKEALKVDEKDIFKEGVKLYFENDDCILEIDDKSKDITISMNKDNIDVATEKDSGFFNFFKGKSKEEDTLSDKELLEMYNETLEEIDEICLEIKSLQKVREEIDQKLEPLKEEVKTKLEEITKTVSKSLDSMGTPESEFYQNQLEDLQDDLEDIKENLEDYREELEEVEDDIQSLYDEKHELINSLEELKEQLNERQIKYEDRVIFRKEEEYRATSCECETEADKKDEKFGGKKFYIGKDGVKLGNISVGSDGEVKIGDKIFVSGDEVKCGNIDIDKNGVRLKSKGGDIFVSEDGSVKVGDILVDGDEVNCGNIKVTDDGVIIKTNDGDIQIKGKNINIGKK